MQLNFTLGLLMGDGSFQINHWKKKYLQYRIMIKLKNEPENIKMLQDIRSYYNIGTININKDSVLWAINNKKEVRGFLELIKNHPLLNLKISTKIQKMIYSLDNSMSYNEYYFLEKDSNKWVWPFSEPLGRNNLSSFDEDMKWWFVGFAEAESCFCIRKNGNQSWSISQKGDLEILIIIKNYFELPNKILLKKCGTHVLETYNLKCCTKIIDFFNNYPLKGHKKVSFELFKIHLEGKQRSQKCRV